MQKNLDTIKFESKNEIQELMTVIDKYVRQNPAEKKNETLKQFFELLDRMEMEW